MPQDVRFIVFNRDEGFAKELRALLLKCDGVKIVAEIDEPALLTQAAEQFAADVLLANLDPSPESVLPMIGEIVSSKKSIAVFAASDSTDGQLILKTMRLGIREFLPKPIDEAVLEEAIGRVATQRVATAQHGKLITVMGMGGGVGATTFATNLAVELAALASRQVTLVDLDYRFGQVATFLDVDAKYTLADLCSSPEQLEQQIIEKTLVKHESGVQILSRPTHLAEADTITAAACVSVFSTLLPFNEYIVVDGPTRYDQCSKAILALSDVNLLLTQLLVPCVRTASRILDGMRDGGYNVDRSRLVFNRVGRDAGHLSVQDVCETLSLKSFATIPDEWTTVSGAINLGEPLQSHSPKSKVRIAIQEIAERLHREGSDSDDGGEKDETKKGLIGRIFAQT